MAPSRGCIVFQEKTPGERESFGGRVEKETNGWGENSSKNGSGGKVEKGTSDWR